MTEVDDRHNIELLQPVHRQISKLPVEPFCRQERPVQWRPVAEKADTDFLKEAEILVPVYVESALLHPHRRAPCRCDRRNAVLDIGREHEERIDHLTKTPS